MGTLFNLAREFPKTKVVTTMPYRRTKPYNELDDTPLVAAKICTIVCLIGYLIKYSAFFDRNQSHKEVIKIACSKQ